MINKFLAKYKHNGITRTVEFDKSEFDQSKAEKWLNSHDIKNFFFLFEPIEPKALDEKTMLFQGDIGFDITADNIMQHIDEGKDIVIDSGGGQHFEGLKIYDRIKLSGKKPTIGVIGICASAAFDVLMAGEVRWASENSRGLIHNPYTVAAGDDEDFQAVANELKAEKEAIAKLYANISGRTQDEVLALMKDDRFMHPAEMLAWNFITEIKTFTNSKNEEEMSKENQELTEKVSKMESVINGIKNLFVDKTAIKNLSVMDANGIEITFPELEEESQIAVGVTATIDGAPASGEVVVGSGMHEGKTLVFENGTLTEIKEPVAEPDTALVEEVEALKVENKSLKASLASSEKVLNSLKEQTTLLQSQIAEFKNLVTKGDENTLNSLENNNNSSIRKPFKK